MITKGIVEEILTPYKARVRLPLLDGIKESRQGVITSDLGVATVCSLPNSSNNISEGDVVFVGFEDMDLGKPIILGHLFKEYSNSTMVDLVLRKLTTTSTTKLSEETSIGNVSSHDIKMLQGTRFNIQNQIDNLNERLSKLEEK